MSRLAFVALVLAAVLLSSGWALACGDKLLLAVGATRWRQLRGSHPASILAYTRPDSPISRIVKDLELHPGLKRAGHKLSIVDDPTKLRETLKAGKYDLLIADVSEAEDLQQQLRSVPGRPILLPVIYQSSRTDAKLAQRRFRFILKAPEAPARYLEAIDDALELRSRDGGAN